MLGVDFYRLFPYAALLHLFGYCRHYPRFGVRHQRHGRIRQRVQLYTNTWQMIASQTPLYVVNDIGEYANMNMVFIFGGIMVSIFIGHDYKSGMSSSSLPPTPRSRIT